MRSALKLLSVALSASLTLTLAAYADEPFDIQSQIGPNPVLPDIQQYLFPPMHLSSVVGWKNGEKPTVAPGLKIEALATEFSIRARSTRFPMGTCWWSKSKAPPPQPITRPKDIVMRFIEKMVTSGGDPGPSNRITLLRYDPAGGKPPTRSVFLDHLHSPFGAVLSPGGIIRAPLRQHRARRFPCRDALPAERFLLGSRTRFSINVALAGKIEGKAKTDRQ